MFITFPLMLTRIIYCLLNFNCFLKKRVMKKEPICPRDVSVQLSPLTGELQVESSCHERELQQRGKENPKQVFLQIVLYCRYQSSLKTKSFSYKKRMFLKFYWQIILLFEYTRKVAFLHFCNKTFFCYLPQLILSAMQKCKVFFYRVTIVYLTAFLHFCWFS